MGQPPIIPGLPPDEPYQPLPPQPMYYAPPPSSKADVVGKTAVGTATVIAILVAIFCLAPALICGGLAILGGFQSSP